MSLTVHIISFGYHRSGPPPDAEGHGGGFVFDCRFLPNPGREERFRSSTGLDEEVRAWLEARPEAAAFCEAVEGMVRMAVDQYRLRGFTSLQVAFGCTGGQHRSVYCASVMQQRLERAGISVTIEHREADAWA
jgi:RNase adaptor protein for sRNA GlmZ degradation